MQRINFRPEQGDSQAGDKVGDRKNDSAKQNCAPYYAAKTGFLVRKEMVRSEVRSESMKMDRGGDDNFRQSLDETAP